MRHSLREFGATAQLHAPERETPDHMVEQGVAGLYAGRSGTCCEALQPVSTLQGV